MRFILFSLCFLPYFVLAAEAPSTLLTGRLQLDSGWTATDNSPHTFTNGSVIRRGWGTLQEFFSPEWSLQITGGQSGDIQLLQDAFLNYTPNNTSLVKIGQIKRLAGLESENSNTTLPLIERSTMVNFFRPRRSYGASYFHQGENWGAQSALTFGNLYGQAPQTDATSLDMRGFLHDNTGDWHLGGNATIAQFQRSIVSLSARGEAARPEEQLLSTGTIRNADDYGVIGMEFLTRLADLTLQSEWQSSLISRKTGEDIHFHGGYVSLAWMLTGEKSSYNGLTGSYNPIELNNPLQWNHGQISGTGAWEIALRYSYLDLDDKNISAGRQESLSLGLNWHLQDNYKLLANYIWHQTSANSRFPHADPQYFLLRTQILF